MALTQTNFVNIFEFSNYTNKCPLCNSKNYLTIYPQFEGNQFYTKNEICLSDAGKLIYSFNIFTNKITGDMFKHYSGNYVDFLIRNSCNKYHFFYEAMLLISYDNMTVEKIDYNRYYFTRTLKDTTHFAINSYIKTNSTNIRMTKNFNTTIIDLSLMEFDFSSKKKIDKKFKNIQLLY